MKKFQIQNKTLLSIYFYLSSLEGFVSLLSVFNVPSMGENTFLMGYSAAKIGLAGMILLIAMIFAIFGVLLSTGWGTANKLVKIYERVFSTPEWLFSTFLILIVLLVLGVLSIVIFISPFSNTLVTTKPIFIRLLPLIVWLLLILLQSMLVLFLTNKDQFHAFDRISRSINIQPLLAVMIFITSLFYLVDQLASLGISLEIGFHYWVFTAVCITGCLLALLKTKYRDRPWQPKTVHYLSGLLVFFITYFIYISTAEYAGYLLTPSKSYFNDLAYAWLNGHLYLDSPSSTMDLTLYNGEWYLAFPPLAAVLMLPLAARYGPLGFSTVLFTITFASINVMLVYWMLETLSKIGWSKLRSRDNIWLVILFGLSSIHWYMSLVGRVWFISRILTVTFLALAVLLVLRCKSPWWVGISLALAMGARPNIVLVYPFLLGIMVQHQREKGEVRTKKVFGWLMASAIPILVVVAGLLWYNYIRFGNILDFGYATMNVGVNISTIRTYGQFHPAFIGYNLKYMLFKLPYISPDCYGRLVPDPQGMSILITTPALIYILRSFRKSFWVIGAWLAIFLEVGLLSMHTGYAWEFGYRFLMDFMIPLLALLAIGAGNRVSWFMRILILAGVVVNFIGILWYFNLWCPV